MNFAVVDGTLVRDTLAILLGQIAVHARLGVAWLFQPGWTGGGGRLTLKNVFNGCLGDLNTYQRHVLVIPKSSLISP